MFDSQLTLSQDYERACQIYATVIRVVPHKQFTFAKLWINFARFEVRRLQLTATRKILERAIGMCPKEALFKRVVVVFVHGGTGGASFVPPAQLGLVLVQHPVGRDGRKGRLHGR